MIILNFPSANLVSTLLLCSCWVAGEMTGGPLKTVGRLSAEKHPPHPPWMLCAFPGMAKALRLSFGYVAYLQQTVIPLLNPAIGKGNPKERIPVFHRDLFRESIKRITIGKIKLYHPQIFISLLSKVLEFSLLLQNHSQPALFKVRFYFSF